MAFEFNFHFSRKDQPRPAGPGPGRWVTWFVAVGAVAREVWHWLG